MMERKLDFNKYDKYGQKLSPGNVCIKMVKEGYNRTMEFCVYKGEVKGQGSTGTYGKFITCDGVRSIKYSNVIFAFDTVGDRRAKTQEITTMTKEFYEGVN